jgi:hypothetical protein
LLLLLFFQQGLQLTILSLMEMSLNGELVVNSSVLSLPLLVTFLRFGQLSFETLHSLGQFDIILLQRL